MGRIKTFVELFESEHGSMSIKKVELSPWAFEYKWLHDGIEAGHMLVAIDTEINTASIVGYMKYSKFDRRPGIGYDYIKMCIDSILSDGFDVLSVNKARNDKSNAVWDKLANEYEVEDSTRKGSPCKKIRANSK